MKKKNIIFRVKIVGKLIFVNRDNLRTLSAILAYVLYYIALYCIMYYIIRQCSERNEELWLPNPKNLH